MYDIDSSIVLAPELCLGLLTKAKETLPEMIVFVDETCCNTSQKEDGNVRKLEVILPKDCV
jgi:hypothetical protein